ncbi:MAG: hypothetical protein J0M17_09840 [Planctomycetes bacterium]|nr:hypothetical protein [Planctomycetota bacterium]
MPSLVATIVEVIFVVITAVIGVLARNKQTRAEVRFMTKSPWVLKTSVFLAIAYAIGIIVI